MATKNNYQKLAETVSEIKFTQEKIVLPTLEAHSKYIEDSKPGVRFSNLLESRITTIIIGAAATGIILLAAKAVGTL